MNEAVLVKLLYSLASEDATEKKKALVELHEATSKDATWIFFALCHILGIEAPEKIHLSALRSLQGMMSEAAGNCIYWTFQPKMQAEVKAKWVIEMMNLASKKALYVAVTECLVSCLRQIHTVTHDSWKEIFAAFTHCINDPTASAYQKYTALDVFSEVKLSYRFNDYVKNNFDKWPSGIALCITDTNPLLVRAVASKAALCLVKYTGSDTLGISLVQAIVKLLSELSAVALDDGAVPFLGAIVKLSDSEPLHFKPHVQSMLESLCRVIRNGQSAAQVRMGGIMAIGSLIRNIPGAVTKTSSVSVDLFDCLFDLSSTIHGDRFSNNGGVVTLYTLRVGGGGYSIHYLTEVEQALGAKQIQAMVRRAISVIREQLTSNVDGQRHAALSMVAYMSMFLTQEFLQSIMPKVVTQLKDTSNHIRYAAYQALFAVLYLPVERGVFQQHKVLLPELLAGLRDEDVWVRSMARRALDTLLRPSDLKPYVSRIMKAGEEDDDDQDGSPTDDGAAPDNKALLHYQGIFKPYTEATWAAIMGSIHADLMSPFTVTTTILLGPASILMPGGVAPHIPALVSAIDQLVAADWEAYGESVILFAQLSIAEFVTIFAKVCPSDFEKISPSVCKLLFTLLGKVDVKQEFFPPVMTAILRLIPSLGKEVLSQSNAWLTPLLSLLDASAAEMDEDYFDFKLHALRSLTDIAALGVGGDFTDQRHRAHVLKVACKYLNHERGTTRQAASGLIGALSHVFQSALTSERTSFTTTAIKDLCRAVTNETSETFEFDCVLCHILTLATICEQCQNEMTDELLGLIARQIAALCGSVSKAQTEISQTLEMRKKKEETTPFPVKIGAKRSREDDATEGIDTDSEDDADNAEDEEDGNEEEEEEEEEWDENLESAPLGMFLMLNITCTKLTTLFPAIRPMLESRLLHFIQVSLTQDEYISTFALSMLGLLLTYNAQLQVDLADVAAAVYAGGQSDDPLLLQLYFRALNKLAPKLAEIPVERKATALDGPNLSMAKVNTTLGKPEILSLEAGTDAIECGLTVLTNFADSLNPKAMARFASVVSKAVPLVTNNDEYASAVHKHLVDSLLLPCFAKHKREIVKKLKKAPNGQLDEATRSAL